MKLPIRNLVNVVRPLGVSAWHVQTVLAGALVIVPGGNS
jgi:hypothetical protein